MHMALAKWEHNQTFLHELFANNDARFIFSHVESSTAKNRADARLQTVRGEYTDKLYSAVDGGLMLVIVQ